MRDKEESMILHIRRLSYNSKKEKRRLIEKEQTEDIDRGISMID